MTTMTTYEPADWRPEPGDVVEVTNQHGTFRCRVSSAGLTLKLSNNGYVANPSHVRRLLVVDPASTVVLDPADAGDVQRFWERAQTSFGLAPVPDGYAAAFLRSLLPTPPLPEPNGLGAVVEDDEGDVLLRDHNGGWLARDQSDVPGFHWGDLAVTRIVSHGVGCSCAGPGCPGGGS